MRAWTRKHPGAGLDGLAIAICLLAIASVVGLSMAYSVRSTNAIAVGRVAYGEWNKNWQVGNGADQTVLTGREADMQHPLDLVHWYASDTEGYATYDHVLVDQVLGLGRTPFVSWGLPVGYSNLAHIDDWASGIKIKSPSVVYIRLFWEFNDVPTGTNGAWGVCNSSRTPAQLIATWKLIVDRFRADGATNVRWVWNPDGTTGSAMYGAQCGSLSTAYPGDSYVDYRGFDTYGYNNQAQYDNINAQTGSTRPMLLGEFASTDGANGPNWIQDLSTRLNNGSMPQVQVVVWFNEGSWLLNSNPNTKAAVKAMLKTAAFQATPTPTPSVSSAPAPSSLVCPVVVAPATGQQVVCTYR